MSNIYYSNMEITKADYLQFHYEGEPYPIILPVWHARKPMGILPGGQSNNIDFVNCPEAYAHIFYLDKENYIWCRAYTKYGNGTLLCSWERTVELGNLMQEPPWTWNIFVASSDVQVFDLFAKDVYDNFALKEISFIRAKLINKWNYNNDGFIII